MSVGCQNQVKSCQVPFLIGIVSTFEKWFFSAYVKVISKMRLYEDSQNITWYSTK